MTWPIMHKLAFPMLCRTPLKVKFFIIKFYGIWRCCEKPPDLNNLYHCQKASIIKSSYILVTCHLLRLGLRAEQFPTFPALIRLFNLCPSLSNPPQPDNSKRIRQPCLFCLTLQEGEKLPSILFWPPRSQGVAFLCISVPFKNMNINRGFSSTLSK